MTTSTGIARERTPQQLLEDFVIGNADFERLEILLRKFNLFDALELVWHEVRHSDFLAFLLDPQESHGLGDAFLKSFLQTALKNRAHSVTPIDVDLWNLTTAEVNREWNNTDIFIRAEEKRLAVIIENKIGSTEHSDQLSRYYKEVGRQYAGWNIVPIYLTLTAEEPSEEHFIAFGYEAVSIALERLVDLYRSTLNPDVRVVIDHYVEMLRRHLVSESEISQLCRKIYEKHKEALDLIFEHRPDRQENVRHMLEDLIGQSPNLVLDRASKTYIAFLPKSLDAEILRQGTGWGNSGRMLLFELHNAADHVTLRLYIGPGPTDVRQRLWDFAKRKRPLFNPSAMLHDKWNSIFARKLLSSKAYELEHDDLEKELRKEWQKFLDKDLPPIVAAFADEKWMYQSSAAGA